MESHTSEPDVHGRLRMVAQFLGLGVIVALVAIYIFNVPVGTVIYFGLLALMFSAQFIMHGGTAGTDEDDQDNQFGHIRGCH